MQRKRSTPAGIRVRHGRGCATLRGGERCNCTPAYEAWVFSPRDKPYILMMNHQSIADIMICWMIAPIPVRFIAKHVLSYVPVVGWVMWIYYLSPESTTV